MHGSLHVFQADYLPEGPADILRQMQGEPPEVLILGPGLPVEGSLKLASVVDLQYPEISVVLAATATPETVLQAMRAGVRDFLDPAADADTIRVMLERASLAAAGRRRGLAPQASEHADHGGGGPGHRGDVAQGRRRQDHGGYQPRRRARQNRHR